VRLWDAATGKELVRLPGKLEACRSGIFSPDGKTIVYLRLTDEPGYSMEAVLWDVAAKRERLVLRARDGVDNVLFTPEGTALVGFVGPRHRALRLWDAATGRLLPAVPGTREMDSAPQTIFAPDGKTLTLYSMLPESPVGKPGLMDLHIYQWAAAELKLETRGEPLPVEPAKETTPKPVSGAASALEALKKEYESAERGFADRLRAAKPGAGRLLLEQERSAALAEFSSRALAIARKDPKDAAAVEALELTLRWTGDSTEGRLGELGREVLALIQKDHLKSASLDRLVPWLAYHRTQASEAALQIIFEQSPHQKVRGRAGYWLGKALAERAEAARLLRQMPELAEDPEIKQQTDNLRRLRATDPEATTRRADEVYEHVRKDYPTVTHNDYQPGTLGEAAEHALFALRNLVIGKTAPDIEGTDLEGKNLRLSDYRGKVVLLIFCGHWCGPCRAMNPQKQALVQRYAGKPFALLEVNSDTDPEEWRLVMKKEGLTWRCWADGGQDGPIARKWNVTMWPTIYLLDAKGVIRYKELRDQPLEKALDSLVAELP
jgi:thiol-disulfide isomerase/thioredoxin